MDYKEKIEELKNLEAIAYGYNINGEVLGMDCSDFEQIMVDAAKSITDLLARAEAAEERCKELEEKCKRLDEAIEWAKYASGTWERAYYNALERAERAEKGKNKGNVMVCPVCQGRGSVHTGFYGNGNCSMDDVRNDKFPSVCHACRGKGILQVNEIKEE